MEKNDKLLHLEEQLLFEQNQLKKEFNYDGKDDRMKYL